MFNYPEEKKKKKRGFRPHVITYQIDFGGGMGLVSSVPYSISVVSGSGQSANCGSPYANRLVAIVKNASGVGISGINVTFTAPATGPSGTFAGTGTRTETVLTDGSGVATSSAFTANATRGLAYTVTAITGALTANFTLSNTTYIDKLLSIYGSNLIWSPALTDVSGTVATDYSYVGGRNGTYQGSITLAGGTGPDNQPCPLFDGINDNVIPTVGALAALNTAGVFNPLEGTLGVWFKFNDVAKLNSATIFHLFAAAADARNRVKFTKFPANTLTCAITVQNVPIQITLSSTFTSLAWHHGLVTWSSSANLVRGYLDGVQIGADQAYPVGTWEVVALNAVWTQIGSHNSSNFFPGNLAYSFLSNSFSMPAMAAAAGSV